MEELGHEDIFGSHYDVLHKSVHTLIKNPSRIARFSDYPGKLWNLGKFGMHTSYGMQVSDCIQVMECNLWNESCYGMQVVME